MFPAIIALPRIAIENGPPPREPVDLLISISDPEQPSARIPAGAARTTLRLQFHDIWEPLAWHVMPSRTDVARCLAAFCATSPRSAWAHCGAGISRSGAIAIALAADCHGPGGEAAAVSSVLSLCPYIAPNPWIIRLADELLDRGVRIEQACEDLIDAWLGLDTMSVKSTSDHDVTDARGWP
jgi:predicted protein tyrosine phosphatase